MVNHPNRARGKKPRVAVSASTTTAAPKRPRVRQAKRSSHDMDWAALVDDVAMSFTQHVATSNVRAQLFCADAGDLNALYLGTLPGEKGIHDCSACRHFLRTYGALVTVLDSGKMEPVMWSVSRAGRIPDFYAETYAAIRERVAGARLLCPFVTKERIWGQPRTGDWTHFAVTPPDALVFRDRLKTPNQEAARIRHNFETVRTALMELKPEPLDELLRLFEGEHLQRSEKFVGPVKWLRDLHSRPKGRRGENLLWRAVASAPDGYCHPKSSVMGPILQAISEGKRFSVIKAQFDAMVHPLRYQRPQAAPAAQNIAQAEKAIEALGLAPALERRFARLDECETIWLPRQQKPPTGTGVFGHLQPKGLPSGAGAVHVPSQTMTWEKFARVVLPSAERLQMMVPSHGAFIGLVTATHADAPPILKWDNPVSWYVYASGSYANSWGLPTGWRTVTGVVPLPTVWSPNPMPHLGDGVILVLEGAVDRNVSSLCLFPEILRTELHPYRSTIEAHSNSRRLGGAAEASACGYDLRKGGQWGSPIKVRALANGAWTEYNLDRWD